MSAGFALLCVLAGIGALCVLATSAILVALSGLFIRDWIRDHNREAADIRQWEQQIRTRT